MRDPRGVVPDDEGTQRHSAMYPNVSSILIRGALRGTQPCTQTSRAWRPRQRTRASLPHTARSCWAALCRLKSSSHQGKSSQAPVKSSQVKGSSVQAPRAAPLRRQRAQRLPSRCEYSQPERRQRAQRLPSKRQGEVAVNVQSRCNPKAIHRQPRGNREAIERQSRGNQESSGVPRSALNLKSSANVRLYLRRSCSK